MPTGLSWIRARDRLGALAFAGLVLAPYADRLRHASLYADDVVRVEQLQTATLGAMLFAPFNEHMAPLFQGVSWVTWRLCGRSLAAAPLAFTLASFVPFLLTLGLLGAVVRRETRSTAAATAGAAVFAVSWLPIESVYWYSASSFTWALAAALVAWLGASRGGTLGPLAASAAAPMFSAVGLLAGPLASLRVLAGGRVSWRGVAGPVAGTLAYLAIASAFRYQHVLADSLARRVAVGPGLWAAVRAPADALVPALAGLRPFEASGAWAWAEAVVAVAAGAGLAWRVVRPGVDANARALVLGGLALVFGGYALAFCARAGDPGAALVRVQRYHLFPMLGLVFLLAPALAQGLKRWGAQPAPAGCVLAALLLATHAGEMRNRARFLRFDDQARTLAAIDRLAVVARASGATRGQVLAALDPIEPAWTPEGTNALSMIPPCAARPTLPDADVRATLLDALDAADRRSVCGGMDASPYLVADETGLETAAVGRASVRFRVVGGVAEGWPSFVEYEMGPPGAAGARAIGFDGRNPASPAAVEVWWRGEGERWSETRSVRLRPPATSTGRVRWVLPLDRLPHWDPTEARRLRLFYHGAGPLAVSSPRLLR